MNDNRDETLLDELVDDFVSRKQEGECPEIDEYCSRFPHLEHQIRELFPTLIFLEEVKSSDVDPRQPVPTKLGKYRILQRLGSGGMGIIYEAEQESLGRRVALKVLHRRRSNEPTTVARFHREARAIAQLHHTNIVPLFEFGEDEGSLFLVMQLINGPTLEEVIDRLKEADTSSATRLLPVPKESSSLTEENPIANDLTVKLGADETESGNGQSDYFRRVSMIGIQIAEALDYAHSRGILHRDVKPSNLLFDKDGVIWLSDFGLAKTDDDELTETGDFLGTLRYMSPERFTGKCDVGADVYALGLTLYELLAFRPCFDAIDRLQLVHQICNEDITRPRSINYQVPRDLETIVMKAVERDPESRYERAGDVARDLRRFLDDQPIKARKTRVTERLWRWGRRNKGLAASLAVTTVLAVALVVASVVYAVHFQQERDRALLAEQLAASRLERLQEENDRAQKAEEVARREESIAQTISRFFTQEMLENASPLRTQNRNLTLRDLVDEASRQIKDQFVEEPTVEIAVRKSLGNTYFNLGQSDAAERHLKRAFDLAEQNLEELNPTRFLIMADLASVYLDKGRVVDAESLLKKAMEGQAKILPVSDIDRLETESTLAALYQRNGRYQLAEKHFKHVWQTKLKDRGLNDKSTLVSQTNLARLYTDVERFDEAIKLLEESSRLQREILGPEHPHTMIAENNLGVAYGESGQLEESKTVFERLQAPTRKVMGETHPMTFSLKNNLAALYFKTGEPKRAEPLMRSVLQAQKATVGLAHESTLSTQNNLAQVLRRVGKIEEADEMMTEAYEIRLREYGPTNARTLKAEVNLGLIRARGEKYNEAIDLFRHSRKEMANQFGEQHDGAILARRALAQALNMVARNEAKSNNWKNASTMTLECVSVEPENRGYWLDGPGSIVLDGQTKEFDEYRSEFIKRHKPATKANEALDVARLLVLAPWNENRQVAQLAEQQTMLAIESNDSRLMPHAYFVQGWINVRNEQWQAARDSLKKCIQLSRRHPKNQTVIASRILQAMVEFRSGDKDEAIKQLSEQQSMMEALPDGQKHGRNPHYVRCLVLLNEAQSIIK